jgi:hypothetical protein
MESDHSCSILFKEPGTGSQLPLSLFIDLEPQDLRRLHPGVGTRGAIAARCFQWRIAGNARVERHY